VKKKILFLEWLDGSCCRRKTLTNQFKLQMQKKLWEEFHFKSTNASQKRKYFFKKIAKNNSSVMARSAGLVGFFWTFGVFCGS